MAGTLDILSDAEYAGGTHLIRVRGWSALAFGVSVDSSAGATLVLPADHEALAVLSMNSVLKIGHAGQFFEYRVMTIEDSLTEPTVTITASPLLHDLGFVFLRQTTAMIPYYNLAASLLTPTEWLDEFVLPALVEQGLTHYERGTITPTKLRSMEWDSETVLEWLWRLVEKDGVEVSLRRNSGTSKYAIDLVALGAADPISLCWIGRNVMALDRHISREGMATSVRPTGPLQSGALERDSAGWVEWDVTSMSDPGSGRMTYTLRNPDGLTVIPPFGVDDEVTGLTVRSLCRDWQMPFSYYAGLYTVGHVFTTAMPAWYKHPNETGLFQYRGLLMYPESAAGSDKLVTWRMPRILGAGTPQERATVAVDFTTCFGLPVTDYGANEAAGRVWWIVTVGGVYYFFGAHPSASGSMTPYIGTSAAPAGVTLNSHFAYRPSNTTIYATGRNSDSKIHKVSVSAVGNAWSSYTHGGTSLNGLGIYYHPTKDRFYFLTSDRFLRVWNPNTDTEGTALDLTSVFANANLYQLDMVVQPTGFADIIAVIGYSAAAGFKIALVNVSSASAPTLETSSAEWYPTDTVAFSGAFYYSPSADRLLFSYHRATALPAYYGMVQSWEVTFDGADYAISLAESHTVSTSVTGAVRYPQRFCEIEGVTYGFSKDGEAWAFASPDGNYLQRDIYDSAASGPTVTTDPKFPEAYVNNYDTEDTLQNGRLRIAAADGALLTELDDPAAIAAYGRIVREIRSEDYFDDPRTGAVNLLENGALTRWNTVVTNNPKYQYSPLGFSIPDNIDEWHPMLDTSAFPAETTVQYSILVTYGGSYSNNVDVRLSSGGPLTLRPGDLLYHGSPLLQVMVAETIEVNNAGYTTVKVTRCNQNSSITTSNGFAFTFNRSALKAWAEDRKVLPVGLASPNGSLISTQVYAAYGVARCEFNVTLPEPLPPGTKLFVGGDFGLWGYTAQTIPDPYIFIRCYDTPNNNASPLFSVQADAASSGFPTSGLQGALYTTYAEGSLTLLGGRKTLRCCFASDTLPLFVKSVWAYVAFESKASLMVNGYGAGAGAYELYHLGRIVRQERSTPQISYTVQALEDDSEAPFVAGGRTRLVDAGRGIDSTTRILSVERLISESGAVSEMPALKIENRESELTRRLIESGVF